MVVALSCCVSLFYIISSVDPFAQALLNFIVYCTPQGLHDNIKKSNRISTYAPCLPISEFVPMSIVFKKKKISLYLIL